MAQPGAHRVWARGPGALWGFVDGNDVLGLIPVNAADNVLHLLIAALGIAAGLASREDPARARHVTA